MEEIEELQLHPQIKTEAAKGRTEPMVNVLWKRSSVSE